MGVRIACPDCRGNAKPGSGMSNVRGPHFSYIYIEYKSCLVWALHGNISLNIGMKNKNTAALLAFLLGGFVILKFYLGKTSDGLWYLFAVLFGWWTVIIPIIVLIICLIDMVKLLSMSEDEFNSEYNKQYFNGHSFGYQQSAPIQQPRPLYQQQTYQSHQQATSNTPQYNSAKQTKKCPYCGEEILAVAKKCKYCGEWLDKPQKTMIRCSICGEEADASLDICPSCGEKLTGRSF